MSETHTVQTSEEHTLVYDETGSGPPLILICGILMHRHRWHEAGYVDRLSSEFRVITMDPLGHGESDKPHDAEAYRGASLTAHIEAVADASSADGAVLWGYSRGGRMAALAAWSNPARYRGVIIGGAPLGVELSASAPEAMAALDDGDWDRYWSHFPVPIPEEVRRRMSDANDPRAISAVMRGAIADTAVVPKPFDVPAVSYWGDGEVFDAAAREAAATFGLDVTVLPTGGHAETFVATDACVDIAMAFLKSLG